MGTGLGDFVRGLGDFRKNLLMVGGSGDSSVMDSRLKGVIRPPSEGLRTSRSKAERDILIGVNGTLRSQNIALHNVFVWSMVGGADLFFWSLK